MKFVLTGLALLAAVPASSPAPSYSSDQLGQLVAPIALYPDPLLAQVLAAATFSDQVPDAARWADEHRALIGVAMALAMQAQRFAGDPTVQSLEPFPTVLDKMASDASWVAELGKAFLVGREDVLDAIQSERVKARDFGYLRSNDHIAVASRPYIEIMPTDPANIVVPAYDPAVVFSAPSAASPATEAIRVGARVDVGGFLPFGWQLGKFEVIGGYFQAWGWGLGGIDWPARSMTINGTLWQRNWTNRKEYVHAYPQLKRFPPKE